MSWRDQLRDASFRGAAFLVESADGAHGRRTATHEYPLRDKPYIEDLGRKTRRLNLEAIVIGDDYMTARDALINAIEQAGSGKLIHPYYGEMQVTVTDDVRVRESTREGGMARISFSCVESGDITYPAATSDTASVSATNAGSAEQAGIDSFAGNFSIGALPAFSVASALGTVTQLLDQVSALARFPGADILQRGTLDALVSGLGNDVSGLLNDPSTLGSRIVEVLGALNATAPDPVSAVAALSQLAAFAPVPPLPSPTTATRIAEANNQAALVQLIQAGSVSEAAIALAGVDFDSYDQAIALRDGVTGPIDALLDATADDQVFRVVSALRTSVYNDVAARGANLARIVQYVPIATLPALVLAYQLYDDPERDADIVSRNPIAHPGFVPAGQSIEVLIDA